MRQGTTLNWLTRNHQNSINASITDSTTTVTRNRYTPYGNTRGTDIPPIGIVLVE